MLITPSEFEEWNNHHVTKAYKEACVDRIEEAKDQLAGSAGMNSDDDNFLRGLIFAYREVLSFRVEDE